MKRLGFALFLSGLMMLVASVASASGHGITAFFNGREVYFDSPPVIEGGRTLVPFRAIFEKVGATVSYDAASQKVTGVRGDLKIEMTINSRTASVNGREVTLDVAPTVKNRRTLVPLRFVGEALGAQVGWDGARQRIDINDPNWPNRGGQVTLAMISAPPGIFNPHIASSVYDAYINDMVFDGFYNLDDALVPRPNLASHWTISADSRTITFYLRDGVKFHDGRPVTIDDAHFSFMAFMHPNYKGPRTTGWNYLVGYDEYKAGTASSVSGLRKVGNNGLAFELKETYAPFFLNNTGFAILPKHLYENVPIEDWGTAKDPNVAKPIGSGPFKFTQHVRNQFVIADRNPDYHLGAPYLDRVIWRVVPQDVGVGSLETGQVDYYEQVPLKDLATAQKISRITVHSFPDMVFQYMGMNVGRAPLSDVNVRRAVAYAVNKKDIISGIMEGHAGEMHTPIHPLTWAYNDDVEQYQFNPAKANELLDAAGWRRGADGIRVKDGKRMTLNLLYPTGNVQRMNTGPVIQAMLKEVGIEVVLELTDFGTLLSKSGAPNFDYDLLFLGFRLGVDPDPAGRHAQAAIKGFNRSQWYTEKSEELLKKAVGTLDIEERKAYYAEWQKHFQEEIPVIHLYASNTNVAIANRVGNFKPRVIDSVWNLQDWYVTR